MTMFNTGHKSASGGFTGQMAKQPRGSTVMGGAAGRVGGGGPAGANYKPTGGRYWKSPMDRSQQESALGRKHQMGMLNADNASLERRMGMMFGGFQGGAGGGYPPDPQNANPALWQNPYQSMYQQQAQNAAPGFNTQWTGGGPQQQGNAGDISRIGYYGNMHNAAMQGIPADQGVAQQYANNLDNSNIGWANFGNNQLGNFMSMWA